MNFKNDEKLNENNFDSLKNFLSCYSFYLFYFDSQVHKRECLFTVHELSATIFLAVHYPKEPRD